MARSILLSDSFFPKICAISTAPPGVNDLKVKATLTGYIIRPFFTSLSELIKNFDIKRISKAPAIFDLDKLKWMNGLYLRNLTLENFHQLAMPYYQKIITRDVDLLELSQVLQLRISYLNEIPEMIDFINEPCNADETLFKNKKMKTNPENSLEALIWVRDALSTFDNFNDDLALHDLFINLAQEKEVKNGRIMYPVRVALT